jgi:hypothetical protein
MTAIGDLLTFKDESEYLDWFFKVKPYLEFHNPVITWAMKFDLALDRDKEKVVVSDGRGTEELVMPQWVKERLEYIERIGTSPRINTWELEEAYIDMKVQPITGSFYSDGGQQLCGAGCWAVSHGFEESSDEYSVMDFLRNELEFSSPYLDGYVMGFDTEEDLDGLVSSYVMSIEFMTDNHIHDAILRAVKGMRDGRDARQRLIENPDIQTDQLVLA